MKKKKESKSEETSVIISDSTVTGRPIVTREELKAYAMEVRDRLLKEEAAPIFAMVAMQQVMSLDAIYELLDKEIKEILQEIWVRLSQSGFHLNKPPLLFGDSDVVVGA
jgi:hypothetical protein